MALTQGSFDNSTVPVTVWGFGAAGPAADRRRRAAPHPAAGRATVLRQPQRLGAGRLRPNPANQPWSVPILNVDEIAVGHYHSCARVGSTVSCWGQNTSGQLGNGSAVTSSNTPVAVTGISTAIALYQPGRSHTCALLAPWRAEPEQSFCWGDNSTGQLGDGGNGGLATRR